MLLVCLGTNIYKAPSFICSGLSKATIDPLPERGLLRAAQGQKISAMGGFFAENNDSDTAQNSASLIQSQGKNQSETIFGERVGPDYCSLTDA